MSVYLFTDIEGSTQLWQKYSAEMPAALARHDSILIESIEKHGGKLIKHLGDGFFAVFEAGYPLAAAVEIQSRLQQEDWGAIGSIKVRMGLHAGESEQRANDYFGTHVNLAARIMAAAWGGQILISPDVLKHSPLPQEAATVNLGNHLLKDLFEPQPILCLQHPNITSEFPPIRSLSTHPNNIPRQDTPFIGRQIQLEQIKSLFKRDKNRLVTLIGPGGMGKTRLSLQVAADLISEYPDGVYFVQLAPINSAQLIPNAIADALQYAYPQGMDLPEQLAAYLENKKILLLLDNFEHVSVGADFVSTLLKNTQHLCVLVTSRERLNLQIEVLFELSGLTAPQNKDAQIFEDFEAVEMFIAYASRANQGLVLSEKDRLAMVEICRMVGGMPLAIQLAATWMRSLTLPEIAIELKKDLDFLSTNQRDLPERHRSMRAAFEYSWTLMTPKEQASFAKLSCFRGGFTQQAAKEICETSTRELAALIDKSLLVHEANGRYQIHELLRQFAAEKLTTIEEFLNQINFKHAQYFASDSEAKLVALATAETAEETIEFDNELDNYRKAWQFTADSLDFSTLLKLSPAIMYIGQLKSRFGEAYEIFHAAVDKLKDEGSKNKENLYSYSQLLIGYGWVNLRLGFIEKSRSAFEEAQENLQTINKNHMPFAAFDPKIGLAIIKNISGDLPAAIELGLKSLELNRNIKDIGNEIEACYVLLGAYSAAGRFEDAIEIGEYGLELLKKNPFHWFKAYFFNELGGVYHAQGDLTKAQNFFAQSLELRTKLRDPEGMAVAMLHLGDIAFEQKDYAQMRSYFEQSLSIYRMINDQGGLTSALYGLGRVSLAENQQKEAREYLKESLQFAINIKFIPQILKIFTGIGIWLKNNNQIQEANTLFETTFYHPASPPIAKKEAYLYLQNKNKDPLISNDEVLLLGQKTIAQLSEIK